MKFTFLLGCLLVVNSLRCSILFAQTISVNVSVDAATAGYRIANDFVGFSLEQKTLTTDGGGGSTVGSFWVATPTALTRFRNLLTNISPASVIRIGGNSGDILGWTAGARGSNTDVNKLYNSDIDKLFGFLSSVNWKGIYTVNFAKDSANYAGNAVAEAASEASYVYSTYGPLLKSISIGNEPMAYVVNTYRNPYNPALYVANYLPVFDAIKAVNSAIPISGGDIGRRTEYNTWNGTYLQSMNNLPSATRPINTFNVHAYPYRANELTGTTEQSIDALINSLSPGSTFQTNLSYLTNLASGYNTPFRMSETNSVASGGLAGVTNSFASAIWALDYLYTLASYKAEGANFHSGGNSLGYSPIYRVSAANGTYAIGAIYYGLVAFMDGARNQRLLPVTPQMTASAPRASYFATTSDDRKTLKVTLINKDFTNSINASVNIPGVAISAASYQTLRPQTNKFDVAAASFYANAQVASDGSFTKGAPTALAPTSNTSFSIALAPMTAVVVTLALQGPPIAGGGSNTVPNAGDTNPVSVPASTFTNTTSSSAVSPGTVTSIRIKTFPTNTTSLTVNATAYTASSAAFSGPTPTGVTIPTDGSGNPTVPIWVDPAVDTNPVSLPFVVVDNLGTESANTGTAALSFLAVPDLTAVMYTRPSSVYGTANCTLVVDLIELNGVATSGLITVYITKDSRLNLSFNPLATTVGNRMVQNGGWAFDGSSNGSFYVLTSSQVIGAGEGLSFGLSGVLRPGLTKGSVSISSILLDNSGGELRIINNSDADKVNYFPR